MNIFHRELSRALASVRASPALKSLGALIDLKDAIWWALYYHKGPGPAASPKKPQEPQERPVETWLTEQARHSAPPSAPPSPPIEAPGPLPDSALLRLARDYLENGRCWAGRLQLD